MCMNIYTYTYIYIYNGMLNHTQNGMSVSFQRVLLTRTRKYLSSPAPAMPNLDPISLRQEPLNWNSERYANHIHSFLFPSPHPFTVKAGARGLTSPEKEVKLPCNV